MSHRTPRAVLALALGWPCAAAAAAPVSIAHDDVACIVAERHPQLDACVTPADSVGRAQVRFRAAGKGPWYAVDLKPQGGCFRGLLPRPLRTTPAIEYYVDVMDRGFAESRKPDRAPDVAYTARVVGSEAECKALKAAAWAAKVPQPVIVSAVHEGSSAAGAATLGAMGEAPVGFSAEGIVMAPPAPPASGVRTPSTETAGSGSSGGAAAGAAAGTAGATVAGVGVTTLAIAGGAVVAAGVVVAAASGGEDGPDGGDDVNLTGTWVGQWTNTLGGTNIPQTTCTGDLTFQVNHSGTSFNGTGSSSGGQCGSGFNAGAGSGTFSGTASGGRVMFTIPFGDASCPGFPYVGTYTANTMSGTMTNSCSLGGIQLNWSGTFSLTRR